MKRVLGWLDDGGPIFERGNEDLETSHFLPALAGWYTLQRYSENGELKVCKTAVVAWEIRTMSGVSHMGEKIVSTWTIPIVADSTDMDGLDYAVLGPDGLVYEYGKDPEPFGSWLEAKKQTAYEHPVE
jgi:hypothetical protein